MFNVSLITKNRAKGVKYFPPAITGLHLVANSDTEVMLAWDEVITRVDEKYYVSTTGAAVVNEETLSNSITILLPDGWVFDTLDVAVTVYNSTYNSFGAQEQLAVHEGDIPPP